MIEILQDNLPIIIFALVLTVLWFVLRTRTSRLESAEEVDRLLSGGQPVVMKFFKNTWGKCLVSNPIVNGIEKELSGQAQVVRVNLFSREGKAVAARFAVKSAGTIIVIDAAGVEAYRHTGLPVRRDILKAVNSN